MQAYDECLINCAALLVLCLWFRVVLFSKQLVYTGRFSRFKIGILLYILNTDWEGVDVVLNHVFVAGVLMGQKSSTETNPPTLCNT